MKDFIKKAKKQAEQVELYQVETKETPVSFENNRLKGIDTREQRISALRVVAKGKLGFATTTGTDMDELLEKALATAEFGRPWEVSFPEQTQLQEIKLFHQPTADIANREMVEMGQKVVDRLKRHHPDVLASARVSCRESTVRLLNSNGFSGEYSRSLFWLLGSFELVEGKNLLSAYKGFSTGKLEDQAEKMTDYLEEVLQKGRKNVPVSSDSYSVLFTPQAMGDVITPLLACADGKAVEKGFSPWKDKIGQEIFNPHLSLYDDPTIAYGPGSGIFDGEGIPATATAIIRDGAVNSFLLDLATAHNLDMKPTGNGWRSRATELPVPTASNVVLSYAHTKPLKEIIGNIKKGIIVHSLMGAWAGNPYTGQVSGNIDLGFLVENGEITGRIKDCMLSINAFQSFKDKIEAASDQQEWGFLFSGANMLMPYMQFADVSISAKS